MTKQEIIEMLKHTEQSLLWSFLAEYAVEDNRFYERLKEALLPEEDDDEEIGDVDYYRVQAEDCFDFGSKRHRGYDYDDLREDAYKAAAGLDSMLSDASYLTGQGKFAEAAAMAMSVAEVIPRNYEEVDDSDGELGGSFANAIDLLCNIVKNASAPLGIKKGIYDWSKKEAADPVYSDYGFDAIQMIYELCCEQLGETDEVLADMDTQIKKAKNDYHKCQAVLRKIRFMQSRNLDTDPVILSYLDLNEVRKIRFKQLQDAGKYEEAIRVAVQGIEIATRQNHSGTVIDWKKSMFDVYLAQGDAVNLLPIAEFLFLYANRYKRDEFYDALKTNTSSANWPDTVNRLLTELEKKNYYDAFSARIMHEHQLWPKLFAYCKKGGINEIIKYENDLKQHFEKELLEYYRDYVEKEVLKTDQNAYMEVARILKQMKTFAAGKEPVKQLLEKYRTMYKRRKNMMTALNSV